ncbi:ROK family protein [Clostridium chromiireducens]|uniref:ROK family protein n=1 Tax=Clostridium chromiireducens TaxID=225345 RepID=UPI003AF6F015
MSNVNANLVKEINLNKLRNAFKIKKIASKPQLAELTELSVVTINSLVNILVENGEVIEDIILPSNGGRPATAYRFNSEFSLALVIYMYEQRREDTIFVAVSDLYGEIIDKIVKKMFEIKKDSFDDLIEKMLTKYPNIKVISFGMPGEEVEGRLLISDYKELKDQLFTTYIKEKFKLPVIFENDINAAVAGYCYSHGVTEKHCVIGIYFPSKYPPGAGIYINGGIYKGRNGLAGEIKYLPFGVDWENFDFNKAQMKEIIIKTLFAFCCMYNPDIIIIYGEEITDTIISEFKNKCNSEIEKIMIPQIIISNELSHDFEIGIKHIALKSLEPILQLKL